jgi:hypothetical protein
VNRSLSILVHGESKVGKSTLSVTAPYPRLLLDVENASRFLPIIPVEWDPKTQAPPVADGTWDTAVVHVRDYDTVLRVYQWLQIGSHQFKSVIIDSISELQVKCLENIAGRGQVQTQQWGDLLRALTGLMRDFRDLTEHPTNPLEAVVLTAMSRDVDGKLKPHLQGQAATVTPYYWDVIGYLAVEEYPNPDPSQGPIRARRMYVDKHPRYEAGERVQGKLGQVVEQGDLNIDHMLDRIFGPRPVPVAAVAAEPEVEPEAVALPPE